ncbi:unnamed protein product [Urochloa decumbens]|uniref:Fe2OG dioxygenase domain-containing protein n=1 Tax=Urochloa decumbens TaxID=240449 RepID=A0ABC9BUS5_9POAL
MAPIEDAKQRLSGISRVDLRGIEPSSKEWEEARAVVAASMEALGAVLVVQDALSPDLRQALFGHAMPELFALPLDVKRSLVSGPARRRTRACAPGRPPTAAPSGTSETSSGRTAATILRSRHGFGVCHQHAGPAEESGDDGLYAATRFRRLHYGVSEAGDGMLMKSHRDPTVLSVVVQHEVEGLEVQAQDGSWLAVAPEPDTVAVIAGELLAVVTNGRMPACVHRVRAPSRRERLLAQFVSVPKDSFTVQPLDELVDADHLPRYNPCDFDGYVRFRYAGEGRKLSDPLEAFCGVAKGP